MSVHHAQCTPLIKKINTSLNPVLKQVVSLSAVIFHLVAFILRLRSVNGLIAAANSMTYSSGPAFFKSERSMGRYEWGSRPWKMLWKFCSSQIEIQHSRNNIFSELCTYYQFRGTAGFSFALIISWCCRSNVL